MTAAGRPIRLDLDAPFCSSGKRGFATEKEARFRLAQARQCRRDDAAQGRVPGRVESGYEECRVCGWYHLHGGPNGRTRRSSYDSRDARRQTRRRR